MKKLSELSTTELSKVLCTIADPAERIFSDPEVMDMLPRLKDLREESKGISVVYMARLMTTISPVMLGEKHLHDVCVIVAALKDVEPAEVLEQPGMDTMSDVFELLTGDKDLARFFRPRGKGKSKED